ncbi:MAG: hypothetical protein KDA74_07925, partial [Planctomycetaceae bacterium]|nr:hypothetical protein [Planctomycetaceae bacterium]
LGFHSAILPGGSAPLVQLHVDELLELSDGEEVWLEVRYRNGQGAELGVGPNALQHELQLARLDGLPILSQFDDDQQTLITNPQILSDLDVHREVTVPNTGGQDFARTVDVFHNPTESAITETVTIVGNLGSDGETVVFNTSDGDTIIEPTDLWIGTDDADGSGTPAIIHYIHGPQGLIPLTVELVGDNIVWTYEITVDPGETVRLAHFTILEESRADAEAAANGLVASTGFTGEAASFLSGEELASLQNFQFSPLDFAATLTDGNLEIVQQTDTDSMLTLIESGGMLTVSAPARTLAAPAGGIQIDANSFTIPVALLTGGSILVTGGEGSDQLTVDTSVSAAGLQVVYEGGSGAGSDSLNLTGTAVSTEFQFDNLHDGNVRLDGAGENFVTYTGLEPITSSIDVTDVTLTYSSASETISVLTPGSGQITVNSTAGEILTLNNPTGTLTLDAGAGTNTLNLNALDAGFTANLKIVDGGGTDTVLLADGLNLGSGDLTIAAEYVNVLGGVTTSGKIDVDATSINFPYWISTLDAGEVSLQAFSTIYLGKVISTGMVEITSTNGNIIDYNDSQINIIATQATLSALNGSIYNTLETEVTNLEAIADGLVEIFSLVDLTTGGAGELNGLQSISSSVRIYAYGGIEVVEDISAKQDVLLQTVGTTVTRLGEDITIRSGATVLSEQSYVALYSEDNLTIEGNTEILASGSTINLRVNYNTTDLVGGILKSSGQLTTHPSYGHTDVYGSSYADSFYIAPSLNSKIRVTAYNPDSSVALADTLNYLTPEGESATEVSSGTGAGSIEFTGGYMGIEYSGIEGLQEGGLEQLADLLLIGGTAGDDVLTINATDANSGTWQLNSGPEMSFSAIHELAFYGLTGNDRLVINNPDGAIFNPAGGILYNAGNQSGDRLELYGGLASSEEHRLVSGETAVYFNGADKATIRYVGVPTVVSQLDTAETTVTGNHITV